MHISPAKGRMLGVLVIVLRRRELGERFSPVHAISIAEGADVVERWKRSVTGESCSLPGLHGMLGQRSCLRSMIMKGRLTWGRGYELDKNV